MYTYISYIHRKCIVYVCIIRIFIYFSFVVRKYKKYWLPDFVGVTVVTSVLDINDMFGRELDDTGKFAVVESIF